jgi:hypothetical protein
MTTGRIFAGLAMALLVSGAGCRAKDSADRDQTTRSTTREAQPATPAATGAAAEVQKVSGSGDTESAGSGIGTGSAATGAPAETGTGATTGSTLQPARTGTTDMMETATRDGGVAG